MRGKVRRVRTGLNRAVGEETALFFGDTRQLLPYEW